MTRRTGLEVDLINLTIKGITLDKMHLKLADIAERRDESAAGEGG